MKKLVLIRHAKSSWSDPRAADFDRKLNKRGKRDAPFMAEKLGERGIRADLIVSSPAKRAKKTAQHMAKGVGYGAADICYDDNAYSFSASDLFGIVQKIDDRHETVFFVGHNHGITDFAEQLTGTMLNNIPTAGIVCMTCKIPHWSEIRPGCAVLDFFDYPKKFLV